MVISFIAFCICGRSLPSQEDGRKSGITLNGLQIYNQYGRCRGLSYHGGISPARSLLAEIPSAAVFCRFSISFSAFCLCDWLQFSLQGCWSSSAFWAPKHQAQTICYIRNSFCCLSPYCRSGFHYLYVKWPNSFALIPEGWNFPKFIKICGLIFSDVQSEDTMPPHRAKG